MNLFVYGTLLVPEIWEAVTGVAELEWHPAILERHVIRRVRGAVYPGIHAAPGAVDPVPGKVYFDVPEEALRRLDAYEDRFYVREEVFPVVPGIGTVAAQTYLVPPDHAASILSEEPWTLEWFVSEELGSFRPHFSAPFADSRGDDIPVGRQARLQQEQPVDRNVGPP